MNLDFSENLQPYDALVLIHPDMCVPGEVIGNPNYFENLEMATCIMMAEEKPIFFLPYYPHTKNTKIHQLADDWHEIQSPSPHFRDLSERNLQLHVDFMAETVGKDPSQMSVAGGGLALGACVTDFMTSYCHELSGPYSSLSLTYDIQRKIKNGKILPDLTDITSLLL